MKPKADYPAALVEASAELLSPEHHAVLRNFYVLGLNYPESANALGIKVGTVKSRLNRARAALEAVREKIERRIATVEDNDPATSRPNP